MTKRSRDAPQFYLTAPAPCPYLPDREERKVFTHLIGRRAVALNDTLTQSGFRRSQTIAYRPACESCRRCVSVRVKVCDFAYSRTLRRVRKRNGNVEVAACPPRATPEQYQLFRSYVCARHHDGGMADMGFSDYQMMIEDSHVETRLLEYRARDTGGLVACCLSDYLADGLSMVYSFFNPQLKIALARRFHDFGPFGADARPWAGAFISWLLGRGLSQDGLQGALFASGAARHGRLAQDRVSAPRLAIFRTCP